MFSQCQMLIYIKLLKLCIALVKKKFNIIRDYTDWMPAIDHSNQMLAHQPELWDFEVV